MRLRICKRENKNNPYISIVCTDRTKFLALKHINLQVHCLYVETHAVVKHYKMIDGNGGGRTNFRSRYKYISRGKNEQRI
jgi:hypothetical protein